MATQAAATKIICTEVYYQILLDIICISSIVNIDNIICRFDGLITGSEPTNSMFSIQSVDTLGITIINNDWLCCDTYLNNIDKEDIFEVVREKLLAETHIYQELQTNNQASSLRNMFYFKK